MSRVATTRHGSLALLTLDDPARRNILSADLCQALSGAVAAAAADPAVKAVAITGSGKAFCAGADLGDLQAASAGDDVRLEAVYRSFLAVADCPLPTLALVNGAAVGAGMNLALACDARLASERAKFDTRFLHLGLHPGGGHGWMLVRAVGWAEASRMLLFAQPADASAALASGLVQQVVAPDALVDAVGAWADALADVPRDLLIDTKASLRLAARATHAESVAHETARQAHSLHQPAFADLIARMQSQIGGR